MKEVLDAAKKGASLLAKSREIIAIAFILYVLVPQIAKFLVLKQLVVFIAGFLSFGFYYALPYFFSEKQQGKKFTIREYFVSILRMCKRLIAPFIMLVLMAFGLILLIMLVAYLMQQVLRINVGFGGVLSTLTTGSVALFLVTLFFRILLAFFMFVPIFFSIENLGFLASMKKSVRFSVKNLRFLLLIIAISMGTYVVETNSLALEYPLIKSWVLPTIFMGINLLETAAALIFYQEKMKSA